MSRHSFQCPLITVAKIRVESFCEVFIRISVYRGAAVMNVKFYVRIFNILKAPHYHLAQLHNRNRSTQRSQHVVRGSPHLQAALLLQLGVAVCYV
jgi:hypothetical protein